MTVRDITDCEASCDAKLGDHYKDWHQSLVGSSKNDD